MAKKYEVYLANLDITVPVHQLFEEDSQVSVRVSDIPKQVAINAHLRGEFVKYWYGPAGGGNRLIEIGEAEVARGPEAADSQKVTLDRLTDELSRLVADEDLDDDKLREASEGLLPSLSDALHAAGYGIVWYKIWSNEHQGWWAPGHKGYVKDRREAGIYPEAEARQIVESANIGLKDVPNEAMVELVADEPYRI